MNAEKSLEAKIANEFVNYFDAKIIAKGFGNSDTKETKTHLFYKDKRIELSEILTYYPTFKAFTEINKN